MAFTRKKLEKTPWRRRTNLNTDFGCGAHTYAVVRGSPANTEVFTGEI